MSTERPDTRDYLKKTREQAGHAVEGFAGLGKGSPLAAEKEESCRAPTIEAGLLYRDRKGNRERHAPEGQGQSWAEIRDNRDMGVHD